MSEFKPAPWLRSPHLQSILPSLQLGRWGIERRTSTLLSNSVPHILDCGAGVRLMGMHATQERRGREPAKQLAVLLHGWEGSADSLYILTLGQYLFERGFDVFRLNLRDHGATHHLNRELFHSCRLDEVIGAVRQIQQTFTGPELNLAGFSLGGNFALRVGVHAAQAGLRLRKIVAVSPVLDPQATLHTLENGLPLYRQYFIRKWVRSLLNKQRAWPEEYDFSELLRKRTLTHMTDQLVRQHTQFPDLHSYLRGYALVGGTLSQLQVPSRIIAAQDDPITLARDLQRLEAGPALQITTTRFGGHCGFVERFTKISWIAEETFAELRA